MRNNGGAPCHRCLVKKTHLFQLGAPADTERTHQRRNASQEQSDVIEAQKFIQNGYAVSSDKVEDVLKWQSLVPRQVCEPAHLHLIHIPDYPIFSCQTAFATELRDLNFHLASALVVDILHEFEIGVWKTLYIHLMRILDTFSNGRNASTLCAELDARYELPSLTSAFFNDARADPVGIEGCQPLGEIRFASFH